MGRGHKVRDGRGHFWAGVLVLVALVPAWAEAWGPILPPRPGGGEVGAEGPAVLVASPSPLAFGVGEKLTFNVKFGIIKAGTAVMEIADLVVLDEQPAYHLRTRLWSNRAFSAIHEVNDRVESWFDQQGRRSLGFERHIREGNYRTDEKVKFDYARGLAIYSNGKEVEIGPSVQDVLSSFYALRTMTLGVGMSQTVSSHASGKNYPVEVQVLREEKLSLPAGEFDCYVVEPLVKGESLFRSRGRLTVWLTRDERRLLVQIRTRASMGSITLELAEYTLGAGPSEEAVQRSAPAGADAETDERPWAGQGW